MKTKIFDFLKNKYKTLGFSDKAFEAVAEYLSRTITTDEQLEAGTEGVEPLLKGFQSDIDKRVNEAIATTEAKYKTPGKEKEPGKEPAAGDEPPAWAKGLIEANNQLKAKLEAMETQKAQTTFIDKVKAKLTEAKVPEHFSKPALIGRSFKDDTEADEFAKELVTGWQQTEQEFANNGLGRNIPPFTTKTTDKGESAEVKAYAEKKLNPEKAAGSLGGKEITTK